MKKQEKNVIAYKAIKVVSNDNKVAFQLLSESVNADCSITFTPRVDKAKNPYWWVQTREKNGNVILQYKLPTNASIDSFVKSYLTGSKKLPKISDFSVNASISDQTEWLNNHKSEFSQLANRCIERVDMKAGVSYHTQTYEFAKGRIIYPGVELDTPLALLK